MMVDNDSSKENGYKINTAKLIIILAMLYITWIALI